VMCEPRSAALGCGPSPTGRRRGVGHF